MWRGQRGVALLRRSPAGLPGFTFTNPEAATFVARMSTPPSDAYKAAYDTLFGRLKTGRLNGSNLIGAFDVLYVRAAPSAQAALLNLMGSSYTATLSASPPVFHPGYGFTTNGFDGYVEWGGWLPSLGVQYQRNSASLGFWSRNPDQSPTGTTRPEAGAISGSPWACARNSSGQATYRINDATTSAAGATTDGSGLVIAVRPDAATKRLYRGAAQLGADAAVASTAPSAVAVREGNAFVTFAQDQLPFAFAGRALGATEVADLNDALGEYLTAIGWQALTVVTRTVAAPTATTTLPDLTTVNVTLTGKGFNPTGMDYDREDGATFWLSDFGKEMQGYPEATSTPRIVHLNAARDTIIGTPIDLNGLGTGLASAIQGIAERTDTHNLIVGGNGKITTVTKAGALVGNVTLAGVNGLAWDSDQSQMIVGSTTGAIWYNPDATIPAVQGSFTLPAPYTTLMDQLSYDPVLKAVFATGGANGAAGFIARIGKGDQNYGWWRLSEVVTLTGSNQIEGHVRKGGLLYDANDSWGHGSGSNAAPNNTNVRPDPWA